MRCSVRLTAQSAEGVAASLVKGVSPANNPVLAKNGQKPSDPGRPGTVHPLYIEQLIRFNLEGGSDPPPRMADLIALRIERLPLEARRTLQALAVIGNVADHGSLRYLLPEIQSFEELLSTLVVAGLIEERASGISTTHPLVRDVILSHGGSIQLDRSPAGGLRVRVRLPV